MEIILTKGQKFRKKLIVACIKGKLTTKEAAIQTGLNIRTIQKNIQDYKQIGDKVFIHGNLGKKRKNEDVEKIFEENKECLIKNLYK